MVSKKKMSLKKKTKSNSKRTKKMNRTAQKIFFTTGSKTLDKLLGKGIVEGTTVLIMGSPHSGKKPLLMKMIKDNCCKYNIAPVIILTEMGVKNWIEMAKKNNWECTANKCNVFFIDGYSRQFNFCPLNDKVKCLDFPFTLSSLSIAVSEQINKIKQEGKKPLVILYSISTLIEIFGSSEVYSFLQFFLGKLRIEGVTVISTMQLGIHGENLETSIASLNECVIKMKDGKLCASGYVTIKDNNWHEYKFVKNELVVKL